MGQGTPEPGHPRRGPVARVGAGVVGFFDSVGKVVGAIAAVLGLLVALGLITLAGSDTSTPPKPSPTPEGDVQIDKSETRAFASVPSLPRQDEPGGRANDYAPDNMLDGSIRTAWVEGVPGLGHGIRLTFRLPSRVRLTRIRIVNGYAKSTKTHLENAAAKAVVISTDGMAKPLRRTLARDSRRQTIRGAFGMTRRVSIQIVSAYPGDRFEDLALSETWFFAQQS